VFLSLAAGGVAGWPAAAAIAGIALIAFGLFFVEVAPDPKPRIGGRSR
jgi:hypothetical protein